MTMMVVPRVAVGSLALVAEGRGWSVCKSQIIMMIIIMMIVQIKYHNDHGEYDHYIRPGPTASVTFHRGKIWSDYDYFDGRMILVMMFLQDDTEPLV